MSQNSSSINRFNAQFTKFSSLNNSVIGGEIPDFTHMHTPTYYSGETVKIPGDNIEIGDVILTFKLDEDYQNYLSVYNWMMNNFENANNKDELIFDSMEYFILGVDYKPIFSFTYEYIFPTTISTIVHDVTTADAEEITFECTFCVNSFKKNTF